MDLSSIDGAKKKLLNDFISMSKGKTTEELLPLILAFSKKAKKEKISFSKDEIGVLFDSLKKDMSPEEQQKAEILMKFGL